VWLYFRFPLSLRMVEEMLAARGIEVSHETVRQWGRKFGQAFANQIRRRLPGPGDKWHLDEVCLMIRGKKHWLWRAVDQDGVVLDVLVQSRRDKKAAKRLLRKLLKRQTRVPRAMITDKLASYSAAKADVMPSVEHRRHKGLYGAIDVKVRVQRQRSSDFVGREDGYELIQSEGSSPSGAGHRAASLYPVGRVGPEP
jgi:putative transposase